MTQIAKAVDSNAQTQVQYIKGPRQNSWEVRQVFSERKKALVLKTVRQLLSFRNMSGTDAIWNTCTNTDSVLSYISAVCLFFGGGRGASPSGQFPVRRNIEHPDLAMETMAFHTAHTRQTDAEKARICVNLDKVGNFLEGKFPLSPGLWWWLGFTLGFIVLRFGLELVSFCADTPAKLHNRTLFWNRFVDNYELTWLNLRGIHTNCVSL